MTDRPILFSAPMVQAILREIYNPGAGKTQTRRVLKPQPSGDVYRFGWSVGQGATWADQNGGYDKLPFWAGDKLWVREQWSGEWAWHDWKPSTRVSGAYGGEVYDRNTIWYWADGNPEYGDWERPRPSIHMPRWASRITLDVTDVRVQRLQEIDEQDAKAEGYEHEIYATRASCWFRTLWDSLNADRGFGWSDNPWVVAITFRPHLCNIDQMEKAA